LSGFKCLFKHSIPKNPDTANEDSYFVSGNACVVSDGATMAFNSGIWSRILTRDFKRYGIISKEFISHSGKVFNKYHHKYYFKGGSIPWNVLESYENGRFATLLGVELLDNRVKITAIGDTIVVLIDGKNFIDSFPLKNSCEFNSNPVLISSNLNANYFLSDEENNFAEWDLSRYENPVILCMTDAIGCWFLQYPEKSIKFIKYLLKVKQKQEFFEHIIIKERVSKRMKLDDTTLIVLGVES
jgi:hypothetical protein